MTWSTLEITTAKEVMTITVNRPEQLNALNTTVLRELKELLETTRNQSGYPIKGVILTGQGERAFVAGADIKAMQAMNAEEGREFGVLGQTVAEAFAQLPVPVIACVNGFALGGGCELAMGCDFIYATENAVFGQPEVNLGLIPGFGGLARLWRYVGPGRARELIYTGRNVRAQEARDMGLVNELFASRAEMLEAAHGTMELIKAKSPLAVSVCKRALGEMYGQSMAGALAVERAGFTQVFSSQDKQEGVAAFREKRKPSFRGK